MVKEYSKQVDPDSASGPRSERSCWWETVESIRRWQAGPNQRRIARSTGLSRVTVRRYVEAAAAGLTCDGPEPSEEQLAALATLSSQARGGLRRRARSCSRPERSKSSAGLQLTRNGLHAKRFPQTRQRLPVPSQLRPGPSPTTGRVCASQAPVRHTAERTSFCAGPRDGRLSRAVDAHDHQRPVAGGSHAQAADGGGRADR